MQTAQNAFASGDKSAAHLIVQYLRAEKQNAAKALELLRELPADTDDCFIVYQRGRIGESVKAELFSRALAEIRAKADAGDPVSGFYYACVSSELY